MISFKETEIIHNILIDKFGGSNGIRDIGLLESALARPFATFDNKDLYINAVEKTAAFWKALSKFIHSLMEIKEQPILK